MPLLAAPGPRLCGLCELRYAMGERLCCCCICSWCSLQPKEIPASAVSTSTHAAACAPAALFSLLPPSFAGPLLLPRLALLLLLLQPSCFFSGSTVLRNTSSCFSVLVLCFSESSKQMRAANKSEKGSLYFPLFALLDLPPSQTSHNEIEKNEKATPPHLRHLRVRALPLPVAHPSSQF